MVEVFRRSAHVFSLGMEICEIVSEEGGRRLVEDFRKCLVQSEREEEQIQVYCVGRGRKRCRGKRKIADTLSKLDMENCNRINIYDLSYVGLIMV